MHQFSAEETALASAEENMFAQEECLREVDREELEAATRVAELQAEVSELRLRSQGLEPARAEDAELRLQITSLRDALWELRVPARAGSECRRGKAPWRGSCTPHNLQFPAARPADAPRLEASGVRRWGQG